MIGRAAFILALSLAGCASPRVEKLAALPRHGVLAKYPEAKGLRTVALDADDWDAIIAERVPRACVPRDDALLDRLESLVARWSKLPAPKTDETRTVTSLSVTCTPFPTIQVNGVTQRVDALWISIDGDSALVQGMLGDGGHLIVRIDASDRAHDALVVTDVQRYFPRDPRDVVVRRAKSDDEPPYLETFVVNGKPPHGLYLASPRGAAGLYTGIARFTVRS